MTGGNLATIRFISGEDRHFISVEEQAEGDAGLAEVLAMLEPGEIEVQICTHHAGTADTPQLMEAKFPPDKKVTPHAHPDDEILVVTEGEIHFGKQIFGPGSSVFIPKMTLYGFQAGPHGLTFLNFRPRGGSSLRRITKDELMMARSTADGPNSSVQ
jgi:quercetin dioxygenase-like cupin family protein